MNPKRKTTGIRVPDHPISQALLEALGNPIISTSAHLPDQMEDFVDLYSLFDALESQVDLIIDDGSITPMGITSSIIDFTTDTPTLVRKGRGWQELQKNLYLN